MKNKNGIHYFEVKDIITQFVSAFDSIVIGRFDKNGNKESDLRVRYVYAPKQKVLHDLVNKAQHITVPAIAVSIANIARDKDRVESKNLGHMINTKGQYSYEVPQPVPVNISVNMSIITRYQDDMDQILANFIPYNNPYIIISWKLPDEFAPSIGVELRSEVLWSEDISFEQPTDMGEGLKYRNIANTSFTIKGWLFKKHPDKAIGNIYEIDTRFYPISSMGQYLSDDLTVFDEFSLSAYPLITSTLTKRVINGESATIKLEGDNFDFTSAVYLSADSASIFSDSLSSYDDFNGIPLSSTEYSIINDNVLYVTTRLLNDVGNISIIVENPSGYVVSDAIEVVNI
jgi:hypothetical protein